MYCGNGRGQIQGPTCLPHQLLEQANTQFDDGGPKQFFRGLDFAGPQGDPGWFGPGSAVWHVHSHMPALVFGLQCAAYIERFDPTHLLDGLDHSRLVGARRGRQAAMPADPEGAAVRLGHSVAFFIGTAYGSTETAERVAQTVRAMHHTVKGVRPDGLAYDADDPDWLRWNYATVVWGIATAHEFYHPKPLRGKKIDRYYREFVRVGHALGGTDLPTTRPRRWSACIVSAAAGPDPRRGDGHRDPFRCRRPRSTGRSATPCPRGPADDPAPVPQHRRAHGQARGGVDHHQRAAHRGG